MTPIVEKYGPTSLMSITQEEAKPATAPMQRVIHIPSSNWIAQIHPLHEKVIAEVGEAEVEEEVQ